VEKKEKNGFVKGDDKAVFFRFLNLDTIVLAEVGNYAKPVLLVESTFQEKKHVLF
jgi:hypothetical protein